MGISKEKPKKKIYELSDEELEELDEDNDYYVEVEDNTEDDDDDYDTSGSWISILEIISKWFIRIGLVIAAILLVLFLVTLKIKTLLLFLLGLVVAFLFGYFFMYCLDILFS